MTTFLWLVGRVWRDFRVELLAILAAAALAAGAYGWAKLARCVQCEAAGGRVACGCTRCKDADLCCCRHRDQCPCPPPTEAPR